MDLPFFILAFGFGTPWMLAWLAAAAAPLVIHLWNRRKHREITWAAMEYLLAAIRKNSRRIRIEQWLLLAIRTLIVVFVVLAMAEPYWSLPGLANAPGQPTHRVLVLDGSLSMAYEHDKTRFERAKEAARQIVSDSPRGDGFTLLLMAAPPRAVINTPAFEARIVLDEIENLKLQHGGGDLDATLVKIDEILSAARRDEPRLTRAEVVFLTDLGRTSWQPELAGADAAAAIRARARRLSEAGVALRIVDLGETKAENMAITALRSSEQFATVARDITFTADIRNFGVEAHADLPVEFLVDTQRVHEERVDLRAGGTATAAFAYRFDLPGNHVVEARISGDALDLDNHRYFALAVKDQLRTLIVDGGSGGGNRGGSEYLVYALDPDAGRDRHGPIHTQVVSESALVELDLKAYDCVFLCNVGQFTAAEAKLLHRYAAGGGGVVFFLGDRVNAERYNQELGGETNSAGRQTPRLLPARLDRPADPAQYHFDPLGYAHPIVSDFRGREDAGLLNTPIYKYFRLKLWEKSQAKVALAFDSGDPAIVEEAIGRGRAVLVALPSTVILDPTTKAVWTALPKWHSFVPLVREILATAVSGQISEANIEVGHPLQASAPASVSEGTLTIASSDESSQTSPSIRLSVSDDGLWNYPDSWFSGVYRASFGSDTTEQEVFAVNVAADGDLVESNLEKADPAELPREFQLGPASHGSDHDTNGQIAGRDRWHRGLLTAAACLLCLETCLAWWFGRRATSP